MREKICLQIICAGTVDFMCRRVSVFLSLIDSLIALLVIIGIVVIIINNRQFNSALGCAHN